MSTASAASPGADTTPSHRATDASTEYSVIGQTSSVSSSITASVNGGGALVGSTKHFVPVTQAPATKTLHKRTGSAAGAAAVAAGTATKNNKVNGPRWWWQLGSLN